MAAVIHGLLLKKHHEMQLGDKRPQAEKGILFLNKKRPPPSSRFEFSCLLLNQDKL